MGLFDKIKKMLFGEKAIEAIQSPNQSNQSLEAIQSIESINQSFNQSPNQSFNQISEQPSSSIELDKESLKVGLAAGYMSKTLLHIEELLDKLATETPTKSWLSLELRSQLSRLEQKLEEHERKSQERLHILINLLHSLQETLPYLPQTIRPQVEVALKRAERHLTPKMQQLVEIVKSKGEISYTDLAAALNISESALRGLLSLAIERGAPLQRFKVSNKGWVRYVQASIESTNQSEQPPNNLEIKSD